MIESKTSSVQKRPMPYFNGPEEMSIYYNMHVRSVQWQDTSKFHDLEKRNDEAADKVEQSNEQDDRRLPFTNKVIG